MCIEVFFLLICHKCALMGNMIWFQTYSYIALICKISMFDNIKDTKIDVEIVYKFHMKIYSLILKKKLPKESR